MAFNPSAGGVQSAFGDFGGAVSDLFAGEGMRTKAKGNRIEADEYDLAAGLARQNEEFTKSSTDIKELQAQRGIYKVLGEQQADIAGSGFSNTGSSLDLLRDSASQGALHKAVLGQQGLIDEAAYEEQAKSYGLMADAARMSADAQDHAAFGADIGGAIKGVAGIAQLAMMFP